jgi:hypothetical protein
MVEDLSVVPHNSHTPGLALKACSSIAPSCRVGSSSLRPPCACDRPMPQEPPPVQEIHTRRLVKFDYAHSLDPHLDEKIHHVPQNL